MRGNKSDSAGFDAVPAGCDIRGDQARYEHNSSRDKDKLQANCLQSGHQLQLHTEGFNPTSPYFKRTEWLYGIGFHQNKSFPKTVL